MINGNEAGQSRAKAEQEGGHRVLNYTERNIITSLAFLFASDPETFLRQLPFNT